MSLKNYIKLAASGIAGGFLGGFLWILFVIFLLYGRYFGILAFMSLLPWVIAPSCGLITVLLIHFISNKVYLPLILKILIGVLVAAIPAILIFRGDGYTPSLLFWMSVSSFAVFVGTTTILVVFRKRT